MNWFNPQVTFTYRSNLATCQIQTSGFTEVIDRYDYIQLLQNYKSTHVNRPKHELIIPWWPGAVKQHWLPVKERGHSLCTI